MATWPDSRPQKRRTKRDGESRRSTFDQPRQVGTRKYHRKIFSNLFVVLLPNKASSSLESPVVCVVVPLLFVGFRVLAFRSSSCDLQRFETLNKTTGDS